MNFIQDRIARGITRPSAFETAMPGWNGEESIMGYVIRTRREREARAKARAARIRKLWICGGSILALPLAMLAGVAIGEALFHAF